MNKTLKTDLVKVSHIDDLSSQIGKEVKIGDNEIALFKLSSGKIKAIENRCPHKQGPLSQGIISGEYIFCPLHDWKIDLDNGEVQKPDDGCVKTYPVEVIDDFIHIRV
ncbi:nitrite reductase (NAD(P)H) small subunit [Salipaludibacillus neizhouensis]|uniref:Nitrite reductase (NAD(P)H) small subunit n=1 Tax=Salipaludibacillus neizhouensis TaxID=885475 RepID=A0A3A9K741_9BACI|nr:nitrite reductase small subunit NirD [Salipaludibacillus neizhouensis]RKL66332.1 nitrite reductase (NAD(P)H) small subunit [Salipaludibacillus neizhouensis]